MFGRGQSIGGVAMLVGSVGGGIIAQYTQLSVSYFVRAGLLFITFLVALVYMKDWGFKPRPPQRVVQEVQYLFGSSLELSWKIPAVRWLMLSGLCTAGVGFYTFYAMQPFLLSLYHDHTAYAIGGLAAALVAGAQIAGGMGITYVQKMFKLRTTVLIGGGVITVVLLCLLGLVSQLWLAIVLLSLWGLVFAATRPVRQAYLNDMIPSEQRATLLSLDSLVAAGGGVVVQPILGKAAGGWGYPASFMMGGVISAVAVPLLFLARWQKVKADPMKKA